VFHKTTPDLQDQDQDRLFWLQTGLVLIPTVSDHITVFDCNGLIRHAARIRVLTVLKLFFFGVWACSTLNMCFFCTVSLSAFLMSNRKFLSRDPVYRTCIELIGSRAQDYYSLHFAIYLNSFVAENATGYYLYLRKYFLI